jgi:hypothetical protein
MSTGTELLRAERIIKHIELYVNDGVWNSGENLEIAFYIEYADAIMKRIEQAPPSIFVRLYIKQKNKVSELRKRWWAVKENFPHKHLNLTQIPKISNDS